MTYNVFGGTLNPTLLVPEEATLSEAVSMAQNHLLWRLLSVSGSMHCQWCRPEMLLVHNHMHIHMNSSYRWTGACWFLGLVFCVFFLNRASLFVILSIIWLSILVQMIAWKYSFLKWCLKWDVKLYSLTCKYTKMAEITLVCFRLFSWEQQRMKDWTFHATSISTRTSLASTRVLSCEQYNLTCLNSDVIVS